MVLELRYRIYGSLIPCSGSRRCRWGWPQIQGLVIRVGSLGLRVSAKDCSMLRSEAHLSEAEARTCQAVRL